MVAVAVTGQVDGYDAAIGGEQWIKMIPPSPVRGTAMNAQQIAHSRRAVAPDAIRNVRIRDDYIGDERSRRQRVEEPARRVNDRVRHEPDHLPHRLIDDETRVRVSA
jgi:hypothetical protein